MEEEVEAREEVVLGHSRPGEGAVKGWEVSPKYLLFLMGEGCVSKTLQALKKRILD